MKKYTSGAFQSTTYGIYKSAQDTITSFPATIYADGENASGIIYGNMQQSGTPTPSSPIYPSECGELVSSNYTIPVISGGVTTSIDLSAVQSTRCINKVVLTGGETWQNYEGENAIRYNTSPIISNGMPMTTIICSHFAFGGFTATNGNAGEITGTNSSAVFRIYLWSNIETLSDWQSYLATQYANNTPVTIWYILAEPASSTLNEPIRKIGDYADSVAAAAIPTTAGSQTFNVDTTLKPSSVSLTYTGWHTHTDKQYSGGSWGALTSGQILRRKKATKRKT